MKTFLDIVRCTWKAEAFSPTAFVVRAVLISVSYYASEIAGLRDYTTLLSGTSANLNVSWQTAATLGLIHLLLYVAFILLAPSFLMTAGLLVAWNQVRRRLARCERGPAGPNEGRQYQSLSGRYARDNPD